MSPKKRMMARQFLTWIPLCRPEASTASAGGLPLCGSVELAMNLVYDS